jgi:hypothetical protein
MIRASAVLAGKMTIDGPGMTLVSGPIVGRMTTGDPGMALASGITVGRTITAVLGTTRGKGEGNPHPHRGLRTLACIPIVYACLEAQPLEATGGDDVV